MNPRAYGDEFVLAVRHYLQTNNLKSLGQINAEILADLSQKFHDHHEAQQKQRKKRGEATPEECNIYDAYPRKIGRVDALAAIRAARLAHPGSDMLGRVQEFARAVARWPKSYRYKDDRDTVPYPASWFRAGRYLDDPKEWLPAGLFERSDDRPTDGVGRRDATTLLEPIGWRDIFKDYIHRDRPWSQLDRTTQQHIVQEMQKLK